MGRLHPKAKNAGSLESSLVRIAGLKNIMEKKQGFLYNLQD